MARSLVHRAAAAAAAAYQSRIQRTIAVRSFLIGHGRHDDEDCNINANNRGRNGKYFYKVNFVFLYNKKALFLLLPDHRTLGRSLFFSLFIKWITRSIYVQLC